MNASDFRPYPSECWTLCAECGEPMEELHGRFECVVMDCPEYIRADAEASGILAPVRDTRGEGERRVKESA